MKRALLALTLLAGASLASADGWLTSYDEALKQSKKSGKPVLVNFTGSDWCTFCIQLDKEVFTKPVFRDWAKKNVILLRLDFPHKPQPAKVAKTNQGIAMRYGITGFPTILFLSATGNVIGHYGYDRGGPTYWTKNAEAILKMGARQGA
ncbi:thioredoxin family protein [Fimbriimonas ginsengisoli]|uniref:Thiol-disulfide isomerase or thioredoxin n=1 Tax=Fimbriimonas ginsengisoli Gsoil 348 TaxID=661478 RepID=A0A068NRZ5_FIMGI|nr:thioredoxin family protein [Fimbriimonas ginsengisoli]AIE86328.1 Thiol-disulfide isomerase or thioredoxin [Fimbriimonas ginsengisoli Gsoil 348]